MSNGISTDRVIGDSLTVPRVSTCPHKIDLVARHLSSICTLQSNPHSVVTYCCPGDPRLLRPALHQNSHFVTPLDVVVTDDIHLFCFPSFDASHLVDVDINPPLGGGAIYRHLRPLFPTRGGDAIYITRFRDLKTSVFHKIIDRARSHHPR